MRPNPTEITPFFRNFPDPTWSSLRQTGNALILGLVREKQQQDKDDKDKQAWAATTVFYNDPHAAGIVYCSTSHGKDFYKFHEQLKRWVRFNRASIGVHLKIEHGLSTIKLSGVEYSSLDVAMLALEDSCEVTLATTLAGHFAGVEQGIDKMPILITSSPNLVAGRQGEWPLWQTLLHEAFGDQFDYFCGSLALARQNLWKKCFAPQRAQVLAGAAGCGKTLIQRRLVTPLLGGRVASPYDYMTKSTNFNADMVTSEHLCLDDDNPHYDKRSRETFGNMIKKVVATPEHALHPKGVDKQMVKVAWFMTISVNDSPHASRILPIFDEALLEKICLYKLVKPPSISYPTSTGAMETFNAQLDAELPAIAYALDTYEIPEQLREERYMIKAYHHRELLIHLRDASSGVLLDELLHDYYHGPNSACSAQRIFASLASYNEESKCILFEIASNSISLGMKLTELANKQKRNPDLLWRSKVEVIENSTLGMNFSP